MQGNTAAENRSIALAREALNGLSAEKAANAVYMILADHRRMTPELLEEIGNKIARAGHYRSREPMP